MARGSLLPRFVRPRRELQPAAGRDEHETGGARPSLDGALGAMGPPAALPPGSVDLRPGTLRRERRRLLHVREERIRDLGGLMLEMFRHDHFREDLVRAQCEELVRIEARLEQVDSALVGARSRRRRSGERTPAERCACGAPLPLGIHFCSNCGRPAQAEPPVIACARCGHPLPADANFCAVCGTALEDADAYSSIHASPSGDTAEDISAGAIRDREGGEAAAPARDERVSRVSASQARRDPWER